MAPLVKKKCENERKIEKRTDLQHGISDPWAVDQSILKQIPDQLGVGCAAAAPGHLCETLQEGYSRRWGGEQKVGRNWPRDRSSVI